jgi:RecA-family ATPase
VTYAEPLSGMMNDVARELLGSPNKRMSHERDGLLRFGANGSIEVNTVEGWFCDYEDGKTRGGVLDLIAHKAGIRDHAAAFRWLEEHGIKQPSNDTGAGAATAPTFYEYADETGEVLFKVERRGKGKAPPFLQHGPDGRGGFHSARGCMQGVRRVLYRLPEVLAADPAEIVFVCEGEKDADRLAKGGLVATTNPGGAGKFLAELAPTLAGRRIVVLQDNDKAGRDHVADVVAKLSGVAAEVASLRLPGGEKSDVSDWLDAGGGSPFELLRRAQEALEKAGPELLPSLDLVELAGARPTPKAFAIERVAPMGEVTLFTGPGSAGKSLLAQQLCTVSAAGIGSCLGLDMIAAPAVYATCEDDPAELHWRQSHICEAVGVPMASLAGKLHLVSLRGELDNALGTEDEKGNYAPSPTYHRLVATIKATGSKLAVLDNVAHLFTGNENDRGEVTRFVNLLNRLARDTGAAILLIGHPPKATNPMVLTHDYSGSTAWLNAVRSQFKIDTPRDADGSVLDRDARVLTVGKANYAPKGEAINFRWHQWAFVLEGDLPPDTRAEISEIIKANGENDAFLSCLRARMEQGDGREVGPSPGPSYAPTQFEGMPQAKGYKKAALKRAMDRLYEIGKIRSLTIRDRKANRDKTIIEEVFEDVHNAPHNSCTTRSHNSAQPAAQPRATHSHISKDIPGAATRAAAPDDDLEYGEQETVDD